MSKKYIHFTAEDFARDGFFIRWVKHPDDASDWFWQSFILEHPEKQEEIRKAREILSLIRFKEDVLDEASYTSLRNRFLLALQEEKEREHVTPSPGYTERWKPFLKVAAALLLLLTSFIVYQTARNTPTNADKLFIQHFALHEDTEERINPKGQKSVILLPDGSKVWLNADSKLSYAKDFINRNKREVYLEGEAFFDVAHHADAPFIVHTSSSIRIKVLGTCFNVKSYQEDQTVETTLVKGKVSIHKTEKDGKSPGKLILKPNQRAVYFKKTNTLNVEDTNPENLIAWRHNHLVFDETPFQEVLTQLERWFDITIHLNNEDYLDCELTAYIRNESLEDVLKLLETSHRIHYRIKGRDVFIYGKLCNL